MGLQVGARSRAVVVLAVLIGGATALAGCSASGGSRGGAAVADQRAESVATGNTMDQPVPEAAAGAELVDQDGHPLTLASLRGKVVVVAPFLTMCQETCPLTSANLFAAAEAAQRDGTAGQVVFLEVTVDPQRDTVRRIHAYSKLYGNAPDWRLATGRPQQVLAFWKALGVTTQQTKHVDTVRDWMTGRVVHDSYDVHHQDVVIIVGQGGHLRWITTGRPDARGTPLPTSLEQFLNGEGRDNYAHPTRGGASSWTAQEVEQAVAYVRGLGAAG